MDKAKGNKGLVPGMKNQPPSLYVLMGLTAYVVLFFFAGMVGFENGSVPLITIVGLGFGVYTMHSLGSLSEKLEEFDTQNKILSEENKKMEGSVNRFQEQNEAMKKSTDALQEENAQVKQQVFFENLFFSPFSFQHFLLPFLITLLSFSPSLLLSFSLSLFLSFSLSLFLSFSRWMNCQPPWRLWILSNKSCKRMPMSTKKISRR